MLENIIGLAHGISNDASATAAHESRAAHEGKIKELDAQVRGR